LSGCVGYYYIIIIYYTLLLFYYYIIIIIYYTYTLPILLRSIPPSLLNHPSLLNPLLSSITNPSFPSILYLSGLTYAYLYLIRIFIFHLIHSSQKLTPHILSEACLEWCSFICVVFGSRGGLLMFCFELAVRVVLYYILYTIVLLHIYYYILYYILYSSLSNPISSSPSSFILYLSGLTYAYLYSSPPNSHPAHFIGGMSRVV